MGKEPDSCYAWWVGASLRIASRYKGVEYDLLSSAKTKEFLGVCEHKRIGGFRKLPQMHYPDLLHSYFSIAALSIMGELPPIICELGISVRAWERISEKGVVPKLRLTHSEAPDNDIDNTALQPIAGRGRKRTWGVALAVVAAVVAHLVVNQRTL